MISFVCFRKALQKDGQSCQSASSVVNIFVTNVSVFSFSSKFH